jgi:hypothetical protein
LSMLPTNLDWSWLFFSVILLCRHISIQCMTPSKILWWKAVLQCGSTHGHELVLHVCWSSIILVL